MNKEYIQAGNNFIVSTDKGLKKTQRLDNMTQILETENNIEEIENLKKLNDNDELYDISKILNRIQKKFLKIFSIIAISITSIVGVTTLILSNIDLAILFSLVSLSSFILVANIVSTINLPKHYKLIKNITDSADELLDSELEKQKQKDKILHVDSKVLADNDLGILGETIKIENTKLIDNLKRKLELIKDYQLMQKNLMKFSDDYLLLSLKLKDMGYSENDINFIYSLMKQDVEQKEKAKTLKLEKK